MRRQVSKNGEKINCWVLILAFASCGNSGEGGKESGTSTTVELEQRVIDSAKVLNVNQFTMVFSVILSAALPQIFIGCNQGLSVFFILLTSVEMVGARSGMGYYVKNYSDLGDYNRTLSAF